MNKRDVKILNHIKYYKIYKMTANFTSFLLNEDDTIEVKIMKLKMVLWMLQTFTILYKSMILYITYRFVLRFGFKELRHITFFQMTLFYISATIAINVLKSAEESK